MVSGIDPMLDPNTPNDSNMIHIPKNTNENECEFGVPDDLIKIKESY
jgi:hypothetical protein